MTHSHDASPSLLGAAFLVEVQRPGKLGDADEQATAYGRRRVYKLLAEARSRGEAGDTIARLWRARLGGKLPCPVSSLACPHLVTRWEKRTPCPTVSTEALPLPQLPSSPPAGFSALMRVLRTTAALRVQAKLQASLRLRWTAASPMGGGGGFGSSCWGRRR